MKRKDLAICFTATKTVVAIVQAVFDDVEQLVDRVRLPSVESLRPASCPLCGHLASTPGRPLGIVGHGTYRRQVLGVLDPATEATTLVRRYLCRGCGHTISVLSDHLHPGRWYAAGVILEALRLHLVDGKCAAEVRRELGLGEGPGRWRSLSRWRRQLLEGLWFWLAKRFGAKEAATTRSEGRRRLLRLFSEPLADRRDPWEVARSLARRTVYFQGVSWPLGHDPPEALAGDLSARSPPATSTQ